MKWLLPVALAALILSTCKKEEDGGPQLVALTGPDTTATIGDTVRLDASGSTGSDYEVLWSIKNQPGDDTIVHSDSMYAWFIPSGNGLYQVQLTLTKGTLFSIAYQNITVSGAVALPDSIPSYTRLLKIAEGSGADYQVRGDMIVTGELVIDPNVIVEFTQNASLQVKDGGLMYADHTSFIAADTSWKGILLSTANNIFSNCLFENAGNTSFTGDDSDRAAVFASGDATLAFSGNTIRSSRGYGIVIRDNADFYFNTANQVYPFTGNHFESNALGPMVIPAGALSDLAGEDFSSETEGSYIEIYASAYSSQESEDPLFSDQGPAFRITGLLTFNKDLTVTKGVEMYFESGAGIRVNGTLTVSGTSDHPVVMDGIASLPESWTGIFVNGQANLSWTSILNAGDAIFSGTDAKAALIAGETLSMQNCTVSGSGGTGVYLPEYAHIVYSDNFSDNTFSGNAVSAVRVRMDDVAKVVEGNSISVASQSIPAIEVHMGLDDPLGTWPDLDAEIDYRILENVKIKSTKDLVIQAGATLQFDPGTLLEVSGGLQASGAAGSEITFEGSAAEAGYWNGIFLNGTKTVVLDHTVIRDGGGDALNAANVIVESTASDVTLIHSTITGSEGYGVLIKTGAQHFDINDPASGNNLDGNTLGGFLDEN